MNPTRAFLDSTLKYKTLLSEIPEAPNHFIYDYQIKHLVFAFEDKDQILQFQAGDTRNAFKSVECQIMDWADDTAYSLNDIVDGANAGFINLQNLENWAETNNLKGDDAKNLEQLCKSIRRKRLEPLMGRKVGDFIAAANIVDTEKNFMSSRTARYKYKIDVSSEIAKESKLYKKISLDLVFKSPQLQQLDHKAARVLGELFNILSDNYISNNKKPLKLVSSESEELISIAEKDSQKARVITDIISEMTDKLAVRTYRRLVDPNFGSILDLV